MRKITIEEVEKIASRYGLQPCKVPGTNIVNIRKNPSGKLEDIGWPQFERMLRERGLAVYKAEDSDFLKIMRDRYR